MACLILIDEVFHDISLFRFDWPELGLQTLIPVELMQDVQAKMDAEGYVSIQPHA